MTRKTVVIGEIQNLGPDEWYCDWYICTNPKCASRSITRVFNYCPRCGAKIQWSEGEPK